MFISVLPYGIRLRVSDAIQQWLPFTARGIEFASFSVTTGSCFVVLYNGISWERTQLSNNREYDPGIAFQISKGSFEWFKVWNQRVETVAEAIYEGTYPTEALLYCSPLPLTGANIKVGTYNIYTADPQGVLSQNYLTTYSEDEVTFTETEGVLLTEEVLSGGGVVFIYVHINQMSNTQLIWVTGAGGGGGGVNSLEAKAPTPQGLTLTFSSVTNPDVQAVLQVTV